LFIFSFSCVALVDVDANLRLEQPQRMNNATNALVNAKE
jgi:hypothetical protein